MKHGLVLGLLTSVISGSIYATEGGTIGYPLGIDAIYSGVMFPKGLTGMLTYQNYSADKVTDSHGNTPSGINSFKINSNALSARFDYTWPETKILGADVGSRATFAFPDVDVKNEVNYVGDVGGSSKGMTDSTITPMMLGWHGKNLQQVAGMDITIPVGKYNKNDAVNVGSGYTTFAPYYAFTWFDRSWDFSGKLVYIINQKNTHTDYKSGNGFTLETSMGYHINPKFTAGITGYVFKQVTDDKQDGEVYEDGYRGQVMGLGPYISYRSDAGPALIIRAYKEYQAENHSKGESLFAGLMYHFK